MSYEAEIRQNDTLPYFDFTLIKNSQGTPHNLTGATVVFSMVSEIGETPKIDEGSVTIVDALAGEVRYSFDAVDTDTVGTFYGEFEVTFSDGRILTFPEGEYIIINIIEEIA